MAPISGLEPSTLYPLHHIGVLLKYIRTARGVRSSELARSCNVSQSTIDRFEEHGSNRGETFSKYVNALQAPGMAIDDDLLLNDHHTVLLRNLYSPPLKYHKYRDTFTQMMRLSEILPENRSPELDRLVRLLQAEKRPAIIMDDLWFDHAINGSLLNLFGILHDPRQPPGLGLPAFFKRWEAWHSIAIKFPQDSPLRRAYQIGERYFLPAVLQVFFEDERTQPYIFTSHMQALIRRLQQLSQTEHHDLFATAWRDVITFTSPPGPEHLLRMLNYRGEQVPFDLRFGERSEVKVRGGYRMRYTLAVWEPLDEASRRVVDETEDHNIYYAAHYDDGTFHVNSWPELVSYPK